MTWAQVAAGTSGARQATPSTTTSPTPINTTTTPPPRQATAPRSWASVISPPNTNRANDLVNQVQSLNLGDSFEPRRAAAQSSTPSPGSAPVSAATPAPVEKWDYYAEAAEEGVEPDSDDDEEDPRHGRARRRAAENIRLTREEHRRAEQRVREPMMTPRERRERREREKPENPRFVESWEFDGRQWGTVMREVRG